MVQTTGIYHIGIPADDLARAERFYTQVLGMKVEGQAGEGGGLLVRMKCGSADVVLFQRPRPLKRNSFKEDGISHNAFEVAPEAFDQAIAFLKTKGCFHEGPVARPSGRAVYFFDSEGNYQQLHCSSR
jgi:catechol 2,3-dioxygenase-like lactoylglutathione lyase family enzyme